MGKPTLPNLLIVGAAKAGTTSLHRYLSFHPQIFMSKRKELNFFDGLRWNKGLDWYKSQFDDSYGVNGEASPRYSGHPDLPGVPQRIKQILGAPKLIYLVRDPVERILSHHTQSVTTPRSFNVNDLEGSRAFYIHRSFYFMQLTEYLKIFPRDSILVIANERLSRRPKEILPQIFRFIGVDADFWTEEFDRRHNVGDSKYSVAPWFERYAPGFVKEQLAQPTWMPWKANRMLFRLSRRGGQPIRKPELTADDDLRLQDRLKHDVAELRKFLGDPLSEWRPYA